jgi:PAS domain S-box-containing protein
LGDAVPLASIIDELPVGVLIMDTDLRVQMMNRVMEALTGYTNREAFGAPCRYILRSSLCAGDCSARLSCRKRGQVSMEGDILNRNRERIPVRFTTAPLFGLKGAPRGYVKSVEDLRLLKQTAEADGSFFFGNIIGSSPEMQRTLRLLPAVAQTDSSVLITGQTGTGKDFLAEAIHRASERAKGPFVKVNCGALPESLLESELFGHQKGAFTGAFETKPGRFRLAHNGSLYLTEIGDLPLTLQVKLLSFLDDQVVYPLGSGKGVHVDVRIIAATHRDLETMVKRGLFREDLLFRLNVVRLHLPPLVERGSDRLLLMDHFLKRFAAKFHKSVRGFTEEALRALKDYHFPGNVRELRNIIEFAVNICDDDKVGTEHLPAYLSAPPAKEEPVAAVSEPAPAQTHFQGNEYADLNMDWAQTERRMIMEAMIKSRGNKSAAAKLLGWGRNTLARKLKSHGVA